MRVPVTVVIVDESGVVKELCRMDGAPLVSVQTAMSKAYAAAAIAMPPDEFYTAIGVSLWEGSSGLEERFTVESVTSPSGLTHQLWNKNDHD